MPQYIITAPNGKKYKVTGPNKEGALAALKQKLEGPAAAPQQSWGDTAMDALKSAGTGVAEGAAGLVGLPRDAGQWLGEQATWAGSRLAGMSNEDIAARQAKAAGVMDAGLAPSSSQALSGIEQATGPLHQPETNAGNYARTIGQFAAGAAVGPGGLVRKAAAAVIPGAASEGAGQLAQAVDPSLEPYARIAAGVAAGVPVATVKSGGSLKAMRDAAPTQADNLASKNAIYDQLDQSGIFYNPGSVQKLARETATALKEKGIDPNLHPNATALLKNLQGRVGARPSFRDMDNLRQNIGGVLRDKSVSNADKMHASILAEKLDKFETSAPLTSNGRVPPDQVKAMADQARELARRDILAKQIDDMSGSLDGYLSGDESALRNQFGSYLKNSAKRKGLTDAERSAFKKVVRREGGLGIATAAGSNLGKAMQIVGGLAAAPATGGSSLLVAGAGLAGNAAIRKGLEKYTKSAVENAKKTVLAGRKAQKEAMSAAEKERAAALARALLATDSARRSATEPFLTDARGQQYPFPASVGP